MVMGKELLTKVFVRYFQKFRNQAIRILSDPAFADDVLQDAFVKMYRHGYSPGTETDASKLISTIVRNESLNTVRKRKKYMELASDYEDELSSAVEREEMFTRLESLMNQKLNDTQKYIIRRKEYEGESLEIIAEELGMQPAAVRMQLSRARKLLRELLENEE